MSTSVLSLFPFSTLCSVMTRALCKSANMFSLDNTDNGRVKIGHQTESTAIR